MENSVRKMLVVWPVHLTLHFLLATGGGMLIGFCPEALIGKLYYNTGIEAYSPAIALTAFLLGYLVSFRLLSPRTATWTWVVGALWLLVGIQELTIGWNASWSPERSRWSYAVANLFGSTLRCSGSECLDELLFTTPFAASVMYSIGAYLRERRLKSAELQMR